MEENNSKEKLEKTKKIKKTISKDLRTKYIIAIVIVLAIVIIDQAFKIYSMNNLQGVNVDSTIGITYKENYSGAFGVKFNSKTMYTLSTIVVLGLIASFMKQQGERISKFTVVVLSVIFAGGLSNVLDKLVHGYVIDYLAINKFGLPVLNIAEILMIISWVALAAIFAKVTYKDIKESKRLKAKKAEERKEKREAITKEDKEAK